jgi:tRNA (guanine37-N1)-methyltransferase
MKKSLISSYDIIGSREKAVAIVEIPEKFSSRKKEIASEIMSEHKNVKSVLKKISERKGILRTREYELIAGDKNTEIIHKEHGCQFKLDPQKVYFSPREGTERLTIAQKIKQKETIMVMFAGVCPFSIVITKIQPKVKKVISIEINTDAVKYMKENIRINKVGDKIIPILGDVNEKYKEWLGKCDRILMPLPHKAGDFLKLAYKCLKSKGGIIYMYLIDSDQLIQKNTEDKIRNLRKQTKRKIEYKIRKVLPYAPGVNKYCVEIHFTKD